MKKNKIKIRWIAWAMCFFFLGVVFRTNDCRAQNVVTMEAMGSGEVVGSEIEKARELAITNSLTDAVNQVANSLVPQEAIIQFFTELNQTVFKDVPSYIQSYKVIDEWTTDNEYHVKVKADVSVDSVKQSLSEAGVIRSRKKLPRLLFLISEQKTSDPVPLYWWDITDRTMVPVSETALTHQMRESGFSITRHEDIPIPAQWIDLRQTPDLSDQQALQLGKNSSAQVLIVGAAQVQIARFIRYQEKELKGVLSLRAIRVDNGQQIASTYQTATLTENASSTGNEEILSLLATLSAKDLSNQLIEIWPKIAQTPTHITLVVHGTQNLPNFVKFRKTLETMPDVGAVLLADLSTDQSSMRVDYKGDTRSLAQSIAENTFDGFRINIFEIKTNLIQLRLEE